MEPNLRSRISLRSIQATNDETDVTDQRKAGPTPGFPFPRTGFALDVTVFCWRAISLRFAHDEDSGAKERREARALGYDMHRQEATAFCAALVRPTAGRGPLPCTPRAPPVPLSSLYA